MENYVFVRRIGRGSYGSVYVCRDKRDGKHYVIKKIDVQQVNAKVSLVCSRVPSLTLLAGANVC